MDAICIWAKTKSHFILLVCLAAVSALAIFGYHKMSFPSTCLK